MATVCVFCGSSEGVRSSYRAAATRLGAVLAGAGHRLVYGGASVGLMRVLADAALAAGGEVLGILPDELLAREIAHPQLAALERVPSLAARKARMIALSDAFVALPGGIGTYDEIFEVLTGVLIGAHTKPLGLVDLHDYWAPLHDLLERGRDEGFIPPHALRGLVMAEDPAQLLELLLPVDAW